MHRSQWLPPLYRSLLGRTASSASSTHLWQFSTGRAARCLVLRNAHTCNWLLRLIAVRSPWLLAYKSCVGASSLRPPLASVAITVLLWPTVSRRLDALNSPGLPLGHMPPSSRLADAQSRSRSSSVCSFSHRSVVSSSHSCYDAAARACIRRLPCTQSAAQTRVACSFLSHVDAR